MNIEETLDELDSKREQLISLLTPLKIEVTEQGISKNRKRYCSGTISNDTLSRRKVLVPQILKLEAEIKEINNKRSALIKGKIITEKGIIKSVIKESLGDDACKRIIQEAERRLNNEAPFKVIIKIKDDSELIKSLKESVDYFYNLARNARLSIDDYITSNEPEINKADYLLSVKSLNKNNPPVSEIDKKRRSLNF